MSSAGFNILFANLNVLLLNFKQEICIFTILKERDFAHSIKTGNDSIIL